MRERVTRCRVVSQSCCCTSARTTFEAIPLQSTQRRKLVADHSKSVSHSWQSRLEAVYYIIESFCNVYTEQNRTRVGVAQSENTGCGRFS